MRAFLSTCITIREQSMKPNAKRLIPQMQKIKLFRLLLPLPQRRAAYSLPVSSLLFHALHQGMMKDMASDTLFSCFYSSSSFSSTTFFITGKPLLHPFLHLRQIFLIICRTPDSPVPIPSALRVREVKFPTSWLSLQSFFRSIHRKAAVLSTEFRVNSRFRIFSESGKKG